MGGGRNKKAAQQSEGGNTDEQDVAMGAQGGQNSEIVQLMKWLAEREEKRREEDKERDNLMLQLVESISRQQTAVTEDLRSTEREREAREETRRREEYERMERFKADQAMLEQRLAIEREEREA